jgi:hypothetical protein
MWICKLIHAPEVISNLRVTSIYLVNLSFVKLFTLKLLLKGIVSPDIAFYPRVYKFQSVLFVRPLIVFKLIYFVVFKHAFYNCFYEKTYYLCRSLLKPKKESLYWVSVSRLWMWKPFRKHLMRMKVYSLSCPAYRNLPVDLRSGFRKPDSHYTSGFLKPASVLTAKSVSRNSDSEMAFSKVCTIRKCFHRSSLNINFWISQELWSKKMLKPKAVLQKVLQ